jgi:2,4-dienoyl-CoA reductase-like NADH-dependent reductase (Old Yellow Enzyme family)
MSEQVHPQLARSFGPCQISDIKLANRIVIAALNRDRASVVPTLLMAKFANLIG